MFSSHTVEGENEQSSARCPCRIASLLWDQTSCLLRTEHICSRQIWARLPFCLVLSLSRKAYKALQHPQGSYTTIISWLRKKDYLMYCSRNILSPNQTFRAKCCSEVYTGITASMLVSISLSKYKSFPSSSILECQLYQRSGGGLKIIFDMKIIRINNKMVILNFSATGIF